MKMGSKNKRGQMTTMLTLQVAESALNITESI